MRCGRNAGVFLIHEMKAVKAARTRGRACDTEADMKKASKGEYGYFRYERKRRALMTFILLLIPVTLFLIGFFIFGTEKNILLIFSMVMVIPFAMGVTGTVAVFLQKSIPEDVYQRIREHEGSLTMAYELYVTNEKASTMLDAVAICGKNIVAYVSNEKADTAFTQDYIKRTMRTAGYGMDVKLMKNLDKFIERMDSMNEHAESLREDIPFTPDSQYPDYTREQMVWLTLTQISL